MKKSALLFCLLCVFGAGQAWAQKKSDKKMKKEFLEAAIPACVNSIDSDATSGGLGNALDAEGYCACMMEALLDQYTVQQLTDMVSTGNRTEMVMAFIEDPKNQGMALACMRNNVKDEKVLKKFMLNNSFGLETCVESLAQQGLGETIKSEGYCQCMFDKMEQQFSLDEILSESTYSGDKFQVMAMECVMANMKEE